MTSYARAPFTLNAHQRPTVGDTKMGFAALDHMGWLVCDGRTVNVSDFELLFNVIQYTFGGSGTTFKLPDFTGRVAGMPGQPLPTDTRSPTTYTQGQAAGYQQHTLIVNEMPSHNHGTQTGTGQPATKYELTSDYTHDHGGSTGINTGTVVTGGGQTTNDTTVTALVSHDNYYTSLTTGTHTHSITPDTHHHTLNPQGGDQPHNNMQPTLFFGNMFIYCGRVNYGCNGIQGQSFVGFPYFAPGNALL